MTQHAQSGGRGSNSSSGAVQKQSCSSDTAKKYHVSGYYENWNGLTYKFAAPSFTSQSKNIYYALFQGVGKQEGIRNHFGVAAVMGNMAIESGYIGGRKQGDMNKPSYNASKDYTKAVDSKAKSKSQFVYDSIGYGLCQWTFWSVKKELYEHADLSNYSIGSWQRQVSYLLKVLKNSYPSLFKKLRNANQSTLWSAVEDFCKQYERPADQGYNQIKNRYNKALNLLEKYRGLDTSKYPAIPPNPDDSNNGKNGGGNNNSLDLDEEPAVVYVPPKAVSVSDAAYAKSIKAKTTDLQKDLNQIIKYKTYEKSGTTPTISKFQSNFKDSKLTSIKTAGKKSKLTTTKNNEGYTLEEVYDFYLTANTIMSNLSSPKKEAVLKDFNSLKAEIYNKYIAAALKYFQVKEGKLNIYGTKFWQECISGLDEKQNIDELKSSQKKTEEEISAIINNYTIQLEEQLENKNLSEKQIQDIEKEINEIAPEYNILTSEYDIHYNIVQNISSRLVGIFNDNFSNDYKYWNQHVVDNPASLLFWFDFLDTDGTMKEYAIPNVGDRTKAVNESNVNAIYYKDIPQLIYYTNEENTDFGKTGYNYVKIGDSMDALFIKSARGTSAKDIIDDMLYNYGYCTEQISLNTIPIYYLEPNTRIFIYDELSHLEGEYLVEKMSLPITYNGNMNIQATKAPERLY